jgi:hypothetical protein
MHGDRSSSQFIVNDLLQQQQQQHLARRELLAGQNVSATVSGSH